MPTLAELKTRIIAETNRDDMGAGSALGDVLDNAIARAIEHHADEGFWFNRARGVAATAQYEETVALPAGMRIPLALSCEGQSWRKQALETIEALPGSGRPTVWAEAAGGVQLWPMPDAAYLLALSGIAELGVPVESNAWTEEGYDLIAARVRLLLYRDTLRDVEGAKLAAEAEEEALAKLRRETRRRARVQLVTDLPMPAAFDMSMG
jgi:hypothetical protein